MKGKIIREGDVVHIYQLSADKGIVFYERKDFLVFYTLFSCLTRQFGITAAGLCIMLNHFHVALYNVTEAAVSAFMCLLKSMFSFEYNKRYSRSGALWPDGFGSSIKRGGKRIRTFASYLYNNPVEKKSCTAAEDYQWNFLKYSMESNPFSARIPLNKARKQYRKAIDIVNHFASRNKPLNYNTLDLVFNDLTTDEQRSLTDYIVSAYQCIDYSVFESYYNDHEQMLAAFKASSGNEYDIKEYVGPSSYREFKTLYRATVNMGFYGRNRTFCSMGDDAKKELFWELARKTGVSHYSIQHYIHYWPDANDIPGKAAALEKRYR